MWEKSPDFSVLMFHPSYQDAVRVYQEHTDPNGVVVVVVVGLVVPCIKKPQALANFSKKFFLLYKWRGREKVFP